MTTKAQRFWIGALLLTFSTASTSGQVVPEPVYPAAERNSFFAAFSGLTRLDNGLASLIYVPGADVINTRRADLPPEHALFTKDDVAGDDLVLIKARLGPQLQPHFVLFTHGASADPAFYVIAEGSGERVASIPGEGLALSDPSRAYAFARFNEMFPKRTEWRLTGSGFSEIRQPYFFVGMSSRAVRGLELRASPGGEPILYVPAGEAVDVILTDGAETAGGMLFLVKTRGDVLGWVQVPITQYVAGVLAGLFWWGD